MKFPLSVMKVNDTIFLLKDEITSDFGRRLSELNIKIYDDDVEGCSFQDEYGDIETFMIRFNDWGNESYLHSDAIVLDDRIKRHSYKIVKRKLDCQDLDDEMLFERYQNAINFYKEKMGYE